MGPRRCDRNTSALPQYGQGRLESGFISNAPYYANRGYTQGYLSEFQAKRIYAPIGVKL